MMTHRTKVLVDHHSHLTQEPPTARPTAPLGGQTLNGRSDASFKARIEAVAAWIHCDASHIDRVQTRAFSLEARVLMSRVETGEKGLHGSAGMMREAVRGPPSMLVRVADIGPL